MEQFLYEVGIVVLFLFGISLAICCMIYAAYVIFWQDEPGPYDED